MPLLKPDFREAIKKNSAKFTSSDQRIADHLLRTYPRCLLESATAIADKIHLNVSTVTRFFPKIGYKNIKEARIELGEHFNFLVDSPLDRYRESLGVNWTGSTFNNELIEHEHANIRNTIGGVDDESVRAFTQLMIDSEKKVYMMGWRKTYSLTYYLYVQLTAIRDNVFLVRTDNCLIADLFTEARPGDVFVLFDFRRYARINRLAASAFKELGGTLVLFTDSPISRTTELADHVFVTATKGVSIFDSYTAGFSLINLLIADILRVSGKSIAQRYENLEKLLKHFEVFSWEHDDALSRLRGTAGSEDSTASS